MTSFLTFSFYSQDPFTNTIEDTRNILGFDLAVVVSDVQDTPPVFIQAPPVTMLPANIKPVRQKFLLPPDFLRI